MNFITFFKIIQREMRLHPYRPLGIQITKLAIYTQNEYKKITIRTLIVLR